MTLATAAVVRCNYAVLRALATAGADVTAIHGYELANPWRGGKNRFNPREDIARDSDCVDRDRIVALTSGHAS